MLSRSAVTFCDSGKTSSVIFSKLTLVLVFSYPPSLSIIHPHSHPPFTYTSRPQLHIPSKSNCNPSQCQVQASITRLSPSKKQNTSCRIACEARPPPLLGCSQAPMRGDRHLHPRLLQLHLSTLRTPWSIQLSSLFMVTLTALCILQSTCCQNMLVTMTRRTRITFLLDSSSSCLPMAKRR